MICTATSSLILLQTLVTVAALPTVGYVEQHRLETYEDLSDDFDLFANLTFRFSCQGKRTGLYADIDYDCRIFHVCDDAEVDLPVVCPNNTLFDQRERICRDEEEVDCDHADEWFYLNELPYSMEANSEEDEADSKKLEEVPSVLPLVSS